MLSPFKILNFLNLLLYTSKDDNGILIIEIVLDEVVEKTNS